MELPPEILVLGVVTGVTYGLLAVGLILAYRASRVINFAHGQIGALAAVVLGVMTTQWGVPYWIAFVLALALGAATGALVELGVVRRLKHAPPLMTFVATLGVAQFLLALTASLATTLTSGRLFPQPAGLPSTDLGALRLTQAYVGMMILGPLAVGALALLTNRTTFGIALRASADNEDGARLLGIRAPRRQTQAWALAGALATLTAALVLPASVAVSSTNALGPTLMLRALAAGALARMASLPVALAAGVAIGVVEQVTIWNAPGGSGVAEIVLFGILIAALLLRPVQGGRLAQHADWSRLASWPALPPAARAIPLVRAAGPALAVVALALAATLPLLLDGDRQLSLATVVCFAVVGLSVWILAGLGGQLSLAQFALAGVGAVFCAGVAESTGSPVTGLLCAPVAGALVALAIGLPALRNDETLLPVATLGFAVAAEAWLFSRPWALASGVHVAPIELGPVNTGTPTGAYGFSLFVLVACLALARNLARSGFGRRLRAVRDNEQAARAFAVPAALVRMQAFAVAGAIAALGGALLSVVLYQVTPSTFPAGAGIDVVAMTVLGGLATVFGVLAGAVYIVGLPVFLTLSSTALAATAFGWLVLILFVPGGLAAVAEPLRRRLVAGLLTISGHDRALARPPEDVAAAEPLAITLPVLRVAPVEDAPSLELHDLVRHYGGVRAVDGVSLQVGAREIVGLVGPNGAGKTTLFDLATGNVRAQSGRVLLDGEDVTALPTSARAARGLIRSFQDAALFATLTVQEVVALGLERSAPTRLAVAALGLRGLERRKQARAAELVAYLGLERWAQTPIHQLSTGTRRVTELACLLALEPRVLLLDEPSAGLAQREAEALAGLLARVHAELGAALIVIDHDLPLVLGLADRVAVLAEGRVVAEGPPSAIARDEGALAVLGMAPPAAALAEVPS